MKKYFLGLVAIVAAIAFSAFTKPVKSTATQDFFFDELTYVATQANVQDVTKWIASSYSCPGSARAACGIQAVDAKYYRLVGGALVLNNAAYTPLDPTDEMTITATLGNASDYIVSTAVSGTPDNQQ
jgi:hypothetical protein